MGCDQIFESITILKDFTYVNWLSIGCSILGVLMILGSIICVIYVAYNSELKTIHVTFGIIVVSIGIWFIISGKITYDWVPCCIDLYVSTEDISLNDLTEYFNVTEVSQIDNTIVCRIMAKPECFQEVLESYRNFSVQQD